MNICLINVNKTGLNPINSPRSNAGRLIEYSEVDGIHLYIIN